MKSKARITQVTRACICLTNKLIIEVTRVANKNKATVKYQTIYSLRYRSDNVGSLVFN